MNWKEMMIIFAIFFIGFSGIVSVDRQCENITGAGGKIGLTLDQTENGTVSFCFFGLEGEIGL